MSTWTGKRVAVLYGGRSSEREVSLRTGAACADALRQKGHEVVLLDVDLEVAARLRAERVEVAFVALHGRFGEDGSIQGLLESMAIPYTGSGVLASAMGMDKTVSKAIFRSLGLAVADYRVFPRASAGSIGVGDLPFGLPCVVKPAGEGSSVGVHLVNEAAELGPACRDAASHAGDVIVERYVKGTEVDVAVLDGKALGAIEIVPANAFYDYAAKYTAGTTKYFYPARLPEAHVRAVMQAAEAAHRGIGCSGVTRVDFIVAGDGTPYILEVNTLPGMTATSLVPKIAAGLGLSFPDLCERILDGAALKA
ncbi:D-alanine/D-alanine ligase [Anaeromyxobacter dehalogenans 2CP-1]|uniref:D-alanine--D-alanine ligase n=1 Tax=Anaeromyxobacter dehalogenans (strain ATCC BAA-258 / DSM 21875 / 2CP-1) TaxID=455488 RepID=DDL_ANAD2|nr:D-alanine--D-alanine ligase [Anaeromyxobacter dehalogenans]B8J8F1.1 RecName: Full=D-alanine--D-alanine ligase; AltName: Full=D-Ala-D-Ala ligase; AltName: Full=D-alanylalanine synthetase [Anaeromyxobacter dehalogenans 2CP-1]ACL67237.1 D-alanine/D-alanine ligase [Anaeromyxobacter dehalogenans 2CP-1]